MTISHTLWGHGPVRVIVLHDWSVSSDGDYAEVKPYLDQDKLTIAFADLRGYGRSKTLEGDYTVDEISRDVAELADSLGWATFSVVGHSMTGMAVQRMMIDMPGRLIGVVATTPIPSSGFPLDEETFAFFESMATDDEAFKQGMHALTSGRYGDGWAARKLAQNRDTVASVPMKAYASMWSKTDFSEQAKGCETPILVVFGEHDNEGLRQSATGPSFESWYPNLKIHCCASGHYPMQETPVDYASAVQDFLLGINSLAAAA